jgi:hypothetical protein
VTVGLRRVEFGLDQPHVETIVADLVNRAEFYLLVRHHSLDEVAQRLIEDLKDEVVALRERLKS